jgi:hypothetical protein
MEVQTKYWPLTVIEERIIYKQLKNWLTRIKKWLIQCHCWKKWIWDLADLKRWKLFSCWCSSARRGEFYKSTSLVHWLSNTKINYVYRWMIQRCTNPNHVSYKNYWWRWIKVAWESFSQFYKDMWETYKEWLTIERTDNNWDYCKDNCKWATVLQQNNNSRSNKMITYNNKTQSMAEWCRELWLSYLKTSQRLRTLQWTVDKAFTII